jgi:hypothetical protein
VDSQTRRSVKTRIFSRTVNKSRTTRASNGAILHIKAPAGGLVDLQHANLVVSAVRDDCCSTALNEDRRSNPEELMGMYRLN